MASPWVVEVAFANLPNAIEGDLIWTDVSERVRGIETDRGATREHDLNQPGTATVVLSNADRALDPTNLDGPYVDGNGTQILPMKRVRIRLVDVGLSVDEGVFEGFVEDWKQGYYGNRDAVATIQATDAFLPLSKTSLPSGPFQIDIEDSAPKYWWRLGEPTGSNIAYDVVQNIPGAAAGGEFGAAGLVAYDSDTAWKQPVPAAAAQIGAPTASVLPTTSAMRLGFTQAAYGSEQAVTTPDHANLDGGTAMDVRARIQVPLVNTTSQIFLAGKRYEGGTTLLKDGWYFDLVRSGSDVYPHLHMPGNAVTGTGQSVWDQVYARAGNNTGATSVVAWTPGELRWFAFTAVASGTPGIWNVNFYTSTVASPPADVTTWTQVGVTQSLDLNAGLFTATAFLANAHPAAIGAQGMPTTGYPGPAFDAYEYYAYQQRSSVNGTLVANVDFTSVGQGWAVGDDDGDTGTDSTGKVWTIQGGSTTPQILGPTQPFSAEVIVQYVDDGAGVAHTILHHGLSDATNNYWRLIMNAAGFPVFDIRAGANIGQVVSNVSIDDNQEIHHVAITYSALGVMKIYVDGVNTTTTPDTQLATMTAGGITIGSADPYVFGDSWTGTLDEVLIYDRELSAAEVAAHYEASTTPWAGDTSGARINKVLDAVGWPADRRDIDTGDSVLQSSAFSGSALDVMQNITLSELIGSLFVARNGDIRFISRGNQADLTPVAAFSDAHGTDQPVAALAPDYGVWLLRNSVTITRAGGQAQRAQDLTSIARYLQQSYDLSNLVHDSDELSLAAATWLVEQYATPKLRVAGLTVIPSRDRATLIPTVAGLELEDWVDVEWTPQGFGDPVTITCVVEKIAHSVGSGGADWDVKLNLSPAPLDIPPPGVITGDSPAPPGSPVNLNSLENRVTQVEGDVEDLEADVAGLLVATADTGWTSVLAAGAGDGRFTNSWVNYGSGYETARYRKIGNQVFIEGLVANGTAGSSVFTLPVGYRPLTNKLRTGLVYQVLTGTNVNTGNNFTDGANITNTGNQTAGTAHVHPHAHQHQVNLTLTNFGWRIDINTAGQVIVASAYSNLYAAIGVSFFID